MARADNDSDTQRVGFFSHTIPRGKLSKGDHIYVYKKGMLYQHHGIYTAEEGDTEVIHFSAPKKTNASVCSSTLKEFLNGGKVRLTVYNEESWLKSHIKKRGTCHQVTSQKAEQVVKDAQHYLENPKDWGKYDVFKHNCETFAYCCKTGKKVDRNTRTQASLFHAPAYRSEETDIATQMFGSGIYSINNV